MAKVRAIVNGVHYYTSKSAIKKQCTSDHSLQNTALYHALDRMGKDLGIGTTVILYDGKMQRHSYDVQLSVV